MKVLITGASGQLGTTLQNAFSSNTENYQIIALNKEQCDITNRAQVQNIFREYQPQWVLNAAAFTAVDSAETQQGQAYDLNVEAVRHLAEESDRNKAKLVHFSTDYVFSNQNDKPYTETDVCTPVSIYGQTKLLGEQIIQNTFDNYLILRVSWLFSPFGHNFLKTIVRLLQEKEYLKIVSDQHGCPTFTFHIADVIQKIINEHATLNGLFHYCDQPATTWYDFACFIQECWVENNKLAKKEIIPITTQEYPTPAVRPAYSVLSCEKLYSATGITSYDWHSGVIEAIDHLRRTSVHE
jgi:dTDP-4-dehydrorhamnose reductase